MRVSHQVIRVLFELAGIEEGTAEGTADSYRNANAGSCVHTFCVFVCLQIYPLKP